MVENKISRIYQGIYLGNLNSVLDHNMLKENEIKVVLSLLKSPLTSFASNVDYYYLPINENMNDELMLIFPKAFRIISNCLEVGKKILVHCRLGISHSPAIVMAFFMEYTKSSFIYAFQLIHEKHPDSIININFLGQIKIYEFLNYELSLEKRPFKAYMFFRWYISFNPPCMDSLYDWFKYWYIFKNYEKPRKTYPVFLCKNCNEELFDINDIIGHIAIGPSLEPAFYVFPLQWICRINFVSTSLIDCPKCYTEIGVYDWDNGSKAQTYLCHITNTMTVSWYEPMIFSIDISRIKRINSEQEQPTENI